MLATLALLLFVSAVAHAQTETVLYNFTGGTDGLGPVGPLLMDSAGDLFGTAVFDGDPTCQCGAVFELTSGGTLNVLHDFTGTPKDGATPLSGLIPAGAGEFYGTTFSGGAQNVGTIFKVSTSGTETVVHNFHGAATGDHPNSGLVHDATTGNFYGMTANGGVSNTNCSNGCGTVFNLAPNGTETLLYEFAGLPNDGGNPYSSLIADASGNLYGTTIGGGPTNNGTIFKITPAGVETVLYRFTGSTDGGSPRDSLVMDGQGNLYGVATNGGSAGFGVVFKLTPAGKLITLHSFLGTPDGTEPAAGLAMDSARNLYGTTAYGGTVSTNFPSGAGIVFKVSPTGTETILYSFTGGSDGANPNGPVLFKSGNLYGTTFGGGTSNDGTLFKVTP